MSGTTIKSTRRSFFLQGGAVLGAGAATAAAAALVSGTQPGVSPPGQLEDREAIRQLQLRFAFLMESQAYEAVAELFTEHADLQLSGLTAAGKADILQLLAEQYHQQRATIIHGAYRQTAAQRRDSVTLSADRLHASAVFHIEVQLDMPLRPDSTAAQMARLQGQMTEQRWEAGRFHARYVKVQEQWQIAALRYSAA